MAASNRRTYIDWARGIAVLLMIEAHTTDAWTLPADKTSVAYSAAVIFGGFAAPLFLWLAGLGVALGASRIAERTGSRGQAVEAMCRRGLEIFVLAFLFRLQAFIVSPPSTPLKLFRVDILNVMGPAMVAAALLWAAGTSTRARVAAYGIAATAFAMATPIVRASHAIDWLPIWVQWYLKPAGEFTTFTLLPWAGFVFAGGAVGTLLAGVRSESVERRLHLALTAVGVAAHCRRLPGGRPAVHLSKLVVLDEFADVVCDPHRHPHARALGVLTRVERISHEITKARNPNGFFFVFSCFRGRSLWPRWVARRCSSTGSTSSWSTATRAGCGGASFHSGAQCWPSWRFRS